MSHGVDSSSAGFDANGRARILIVGTETDSATLTATLGEIGHQVCATVSSGRQAIAAAEELRPDLALIDLALDGPVSAVDAAVRVRDRYDVPVIYVTDEEVAAGSLSQARETDPAGYLLKPVTRLQLLLTIDTGLRAHRRESAHRHAAQRLESAVESAAEGVIVTDQNGQDLFVNSRAADILGHFTIESDPDKWHDLYGLFRPDGKTPFPIDELPLFRALQGEPVDDVNLVTRNDYRPEGVFVRGSARPLTYRDSCEIQGAVLVFQDITTLKETEAELRQTIADLRSQATLTDTVVNSISDGLIVTDRDGDIVLWNPASEFIFGKGPIDRRLARRSDVYGLYYPDRVTKFLSVNLQVVEWA